MTKVVINGCYGGFSLSKEAMLLYAELRGMTLYPEENHYGLTTYWTVPPEQRPETVDGVTWANKPLEERKAYNESYKSNVLSDHDLSRDDTTLVKVVQELGDRANGRFASLNIIEIPDDAKWHIEEYDGIEWIAEDHRTWPDQGRE